MANRHTLHKSDLSLFKSWLELDGWTILPNKDFYEVIRAKKIIKNRERLFIVYRRLDKKSQHFSITDANIGIVRAFYKWKKERENERK